MAIFYFSIIQGNWYVYGIDHSKRFSMNTQEFQWKILETERGSRTFYFVNMVWQLLDDHLPAPSILFGCSVKMDVNTVFHEHQALACHHGCAHWPPSLTGLHLPWHQASLCPQLPRSLAPALHGGQQPPSTGSFLLTCLGIFWNKLP